MDQRERTPDQGADALKLRTLLMDLYNYFRMDSSEDPLILFEQLCCVLLQMDREWSFPAKLEHVSTDIYWYRTMLERFNQMRPFPLPSPVLPQLEERAELVRRLMNTAKEIITCAQNNTVQIGLLLFDLLEAVLQARNSRIVYTPVQMAREIVGLLRPQIAPLSSMAMLDPACGSGAFLIALAERVQAETSINWVNTCGVEQDDQLYRCVTLLMEFYQTPRVFVRMRGSAYTLQADPVHYNLILANPPFLSQSQRDRKIEEHEGRDLPVPTRDSYQALVQRILLRLIPGGDCAIIVPDSFLKNTFRSAVRVRQWILANFRCEGVVKLPAHAFYPQASVNASILFLRQPEAPQEAVDANRCVFFFSVEPDEPASDAKRRPMTERDFEELRQVWPQRDFYRAQWLEGPRAENVLQLDVPRQWDHPHFWFGSMEDIAGNDHSLLPEQYRPQSISMEKFRDPAEILDELQELGQDILDLIAEMAEAEYEHRRMDSRGAE